jgi:hypothetical protein
VTADVRELFDKRVTADYQTSRTINREVALRCVLLAERVLESMDEANG